MLNTNEAQANHTAAIQSLLHRCHPKSYLGSDWRLSPSSFHPRPSCKFPRNSSNQGVWGTEAKTSCERVPVAVMSSIDLDLDWFE